MFTDHRKKSCFFDYIFLLWKRLLNSITEAFKFPAPKKMTSIKKYIFPSLEKIICLIIIFEFLSTGLGFCSHTHSHVHDVTQITALHRHDGAMPGNNHFHSQSDGDTCHNGDKSNCEFHCSCQGGFIGVLIPLFIINPQTCSFFYTQEMQALQSRYDIIIYHPPMFISWNFQAVYLFVRWNCINSYCRFRNFHCIFLRFIQRGDKLPNFSTISLSIIRITYSEKYQFGETQCRINWNGYF